MSRRTFAGLAGLAGAAVLLPRPARAAYPDRAIRLIVPFAAGGAVDAVARVLGKALAANLGEAIIIDNRGGAGGVVGMDAAVSRALPTAIPCCYPTAASLRCPASTANCRSILRAILPE
jgi:tripartite-type tricarboxylate transporter receptor subunit TctC